MANAPRARPLWSMVGFTSSACHSPKIFKPERPPQTTSSTQNEGGA